MAINKRDLKAYVRFDGTGRLISGSLILQRFKPKVGNWQEIDAYECCNPTTTTTTTTVSPTTTTTTTVAEVCYQWQVDVPDGGSGTLTGISCFGEELSVSLVGPVVAETTCAFELSGTGDVVVTQLGLCPD